MRNPTAWQYFAVVLDIILISSITITIIKMVLNKIPALHLLPYVFPIMLVGLGIGYVNDKAFFDPERYISFGLLNTYLCIFALFLLMCVCYLVYIWIKWIVN